MPTPRIALAALFVASLAAASCSSNTQFCGSDLDCDLGANCINARCTTLDAGPQQGMGGACFESLQCVTGLSCVLDGTGLAGGLCTETCSGGSCPTNTICADLRSTPVNEQICLPLPAAGDGGVCRAGWSACPSLSGACLPSSLCPASGINTAASADLGMACAPGSCAAGETCRFGLDFPGGVCTLPCSTSDATTCPSNGACSATDQGPLCLATCATSASCRTGYGCAGAAGSTFVCSTAAQGPRACTPGSLPLIVAGGTAGPASPPGFCLEPQAVSALPSSMVQEFGAHTIGDVIEFQVPSQAASISIVSQAIHAHGTINDDGTVLDNTAAPTQITAPGSNVIYNDGVQPPDDLSTALVYYGTFAPVTSVMTFPNTTAGLAFADGGLPAGTWSFQVNDYAAECLNTDGCDGGSNDGLYDVSVLVKPGPATTSATIDIAFYLVGAQGLTSATAGGNPHVQRMLTTLESLYGAAGICLGSVTFYDVPPWAQALYASGINADKIEPCDNLDQMFTLARAGNTLNFFLVEDITSTDSSGQVIGIDGTIPGPSSLGGTVHSGAAVNGSDLSAGSCLGSGIDPGNCGADLVAYIAAHEGGHWMGLYHTTEASGDLFDPLSDTATCSCTLCTTGSTQSMCSGGTATVQASDCAGTTAACGGANDLMFWEFDQQISRGSLTAQQGEVMRRNVLAQ